MTMIVKCGGSILDAMLAPGGNQKSVFDEIAAQHEPLALVFGAGKQIGGSLAAAGHESIFIDGLRMTPPEAMPRLIAEHRKLARHISSALRLRGCRARAVNNQGELLSCRAAYGSGGQQLGAVGHPMTADVRYIRLLWRKGIIPVVAPLGALSGAPCNVNADAVAGALAGALAVPVVFLTDVAGVMLDDKIQETISASMVQRAIAEGKIYGGMIPKTVACLEAVRFGAPYATIAAAGGSLLGSIGTRITATASEVG